MNFYTENNGNVYCAGTLNSWSPIEVTDAGLIITDTDSNIHGIETYFLSPSGTDLEHKDYFVYKDNGSYSGYFRSDNTSPRDYCTIDEETLRNFRDSLGYSETIEFTMN